jgi:hypothetical protein
MPCSICRQVGHNKLKCPKNQTKNQTKYHTNTDTNILTFIVDALDCIDNVQGTNMYDHLLTDFEPTTSYIIVSLYSEREGHCGYCSDNDGTKYSDSYNRDKIYITLPTELTDQLPILQKYIDDGYFNDYELSWHSQCYCGGNRIKNCIISLDIHV